MREECAQLTHKRLPKAKEISELEGELGRYELEVRDGTLDALGSDQD